MKLLFNITANILLLFSTAIKANELDDFYLFSGVMHGNLFGDTHIENFYPFKGDKHKDFSGDIVVHLADGSEWKGHPKDKNRLSQWDPGDSVHISLRKSNYWFKREHKFFLNNHSKKETVKVMRVDSGPLSMFISSTSEIYYTEVEIIPVWGNDKNGNYVFLYNKEKPIFKKNITLNDGSGWIIHKDFKKFTRGKSAYVAYDDTENQFFLIVGHEREAIWSYADQGAAQTRR